VDAEPRDVAGGDLYLRHCASCHGVDGRGGGPVGASLKRPPTDLTSLAARAGRFDETAVMSAIDGRRAVAEHGSREMPVWGDEFFEDAPPLTPNLVEGAKQHLIAVLLEYLETIQTERRS